MQIIKYLLCITLLFVILVFSQSSFVFAQEDAGETSPQNTVDTSNETKGRIHEPDFMINVGVLTPGGKTLATGGTQANTDSLLERIIQSLIVLIGVFAVLIMTIGVGFMVVFHGDDTLLSRGKTMFMAGIIAIAIALGSGLLVNIFINILGNN